MLRICLFLFLGLGLVHAALKPDVEMEVTGPSVHLSLPGIAAPAVQSYLSKSLDEAPTLSLVEAIPADACGPLKNKPKGPWAAVIARGTCQFGIKLHNAQRAGAAAVAPRLPVPVRCMQHPAMPVRDLGMPAPSVYQKEV